MVQTKGFNALKAAQTFGIQHALATEVLKDKPVTSEEFIHKDGDFDKAARPNTVRGGLNRIFTEVSELQSIKFSSINTQIKQETNVISFAVKNAFEQPFQGQGDLTQLAGEVGRKFDEKA